MRGPGAGAQNFCEDTYDCVDEECQFKHLLFKTTVSPFCHCVEDGEGDWLIERQIYFVECCCDPDSEVTLEPATAGAVEAETAAGARTAEAESAATPALVKVTGGATLGARSVGS